MAFKSFKRVLYTGMTGLIAASLSLGSAMLPANAAPTSRDVCASAVSVGNSLGALDQRVAQSDMGMEPPANPGGNYQVPSELNDTVATTLACTDPWSVTGPDMKDGFFEFATLSDRHDSYFDGDGFLHLEFTDVRPGASGMLPRVINAATAVGSVATNNATRITWRATNSPSGTQPDTGTTYSLSWKYGPFDSAAQEQFDSGSLVIAIFGMGISTSTTDLLTSMKVKVWTSTGAVTFNANGGNGTMGDQFGSAAQALATNAFTRTGFTFAGWTTNQDGTGVSYSNAENFDFSGDLELFAQWAANPAPTVSENLAATGSDSTTSLLIGVAAIVTGLVAVSSRRKKLGFPRTPAKHRA